MVKATLRTAKTAATPAPTPAIEPEVLAPGPTPQKSAGNGLTDIIPPGEPAAEIEEPAPPPLARRSSSAVATSASFSGEGLEGEWGQEDLKYPQLKIVQGSGELSKQFDNGTIIYNDMELLPPPSVKEGAVNTPIRFIPVTLTKQFREKLSQEAVKAGEMPRIFNSIQEVQEAGLTTRWVGNERPDNYAEPSSKMLILIEQPEGVDHPSFVLTLDGKQYAAALYYAAGGAFRDSAKVIFNTALTSLLVPILGEDGQPKKNGAGAVMKKPMLWKNFWTLNFVKKQVGEFVVWRPVVKLLAKEQTGAELRAYCEQLVHGTPEAAEAE
jgi:hypothetical protein